MSARPNPGIHGVLSHALAEHCENVGGQVYAAPKVIVQNARHGSHQRLCEAIAYVWHVQEVRSSTQTNKRPWQYFGAPLAISFDRWPTVTDNWLSLPVASILLSTLSSYSFSRACAVITPERYVTAFQQELYTTELDTTYVIGIRNVTPRLRTSVGAALRRRNVNATRQEVSRLVLAWNRHSVPRALT